MNDPDAFRQPTAEGWATIAGAINSMRAIQQPMTLAVTSPDFGTLWIDFVRERFYIDRALSAMPEYPRGIVLYSQPQPPGHELFPWVQWSPLDPFLWQIAPLAAREAPAMWRRRTDRYSLTRWPNLTQLPHTPADIRILAALGGGQALTAQEAAVIADVSDDDVERILDALSLMNCVESTLGSPVPPPEVEQATQRAQSATRREGGLFARLRRRRELVAHG